MTAGHRCWQFQTLSPARLSATCCRCRCVLRGDEYVALVMKPGTLLGFSTHFHELVRSFLFYFLTYLQAGSSAFCLADMLH